MSSFREIESGPNFEVYQGALSVQRLDWTSQGHIRTTHIGYMEEWCPDRIIIRWDAAFRAKQKFHVFHDFSRATGYESGFRVKLTAWAKAHPDAQSGIYVHTTNKLVSMGVTVASMALGGLLTNAPKRQDFDVALKKYGLPVNVSLPDFKPET